jgi:hypothetical protein
MGTTGGNRGVRRRRVLRTGTASAAVVVAGCSSFDVFGGGYDSVRVDVQAKGIVWSGRVSFESEDGTRVSIPIDRALGSRSYKLPEDIDADGYDVINEPVGVKAVPERGVSSGRPLTVVVYCEGEQCGEATTRSVEEAARVEVS